MLYISKELSSPQAALNLQGLFRREINSLAFMPKRIRTVDEQPWKDLGVRRFMVKNYYVYFIVDDSEMTVKVIAVIYTGRDQAAQMAERNLSE